jgi:hypothetical protein
MMSAETKAVWLAERCGKLTASRMSDAMSFLKNGQPSEKRIKLMHELLAERLTGFNARHFVTPAMQDGLEFEDEMFNKFVERTGRDLRQSKFYEHATISSFGATPDRELDDGLVEGKVPQPSTFVRWVLDGVVPEEHKPQMIAQCLCANKSWVGFMAYCPSIKDERRQLFLRKFVPTEDEKEKVFSAAVGFLNELDQMFDDFVSAPEQT